MTMAKMTIASRVSPRTAITGGDQHDKEVLIA
jgi:hypothetical protein